MPIWLRVMERARNMIQPARRGAAATLVRGGPQTQQVSKPWRPCQSASDGGLPSGYQGSGEHAAVQ